ncbi:surface lipoprotein assembly modifier [Rhodocaloribacter sp.]
MKHASLLSGLLGVVIACAVSATVARAQDPSETAARAQDATEGEAAWPARHIDAGLLFSNSYDSNINHDAEPVSSYGVVPGLRVRYLSAPQKPLYTLVYTVALHSYTNTDRWDRVSHQFTALYAPKLSDRLRARTSATVSLRGSSEDRDISNQFLLGQEFEFRIDRNHRLYLYGTYRLKRFPDKPENNAFKPNVGLDFERRLPEGRRWGVGVRYEIKRRDNPRSDYGRWTFSLEYRTAYFGGGNQIRLGAKYRRKYYARKLVTIEKQDVLRRDQRWTLSFAWRRAFGRGFLVELGYKFENRDSNNPAKLYQAHLVELAFAYDLWR